MTVGPAGNISTKAERATSGRQCVPYKAASVSDARVRVYGGDTAVVTGRIVINTPDGKSLPEARFTAVFVKAGGIWKEASYQGTPIRPATTPEK